MMDARIDEAWQFHRSGDFAKAEFLYRAIIRADPRNFLAQYRLGFLYGQRGLWEEAQQLFAKAIAINPASADAHFLRGTVLSKLLRQEEAVAAFDRAIALAPPFPEATLNRAAALFLLRRYTEAASDYDKLLRLDPDSPFARGNRLFCRLQCCEWSSLKEDTAAILAALALGKRVIAPFDAKSLPLSPVDELRCAEIWTSDQYPSVPAAATRVRSQHQKIRVAYLSADFRETPVATLLAEVFERHDRDRFETFGVSFGFNDRSRTRERLERAFDRFIDITSESDADVARLLNQGEIDIAVDLMGYTEGSRPSILKHRAAPIQVNYLGYPGTMASDAIDYIIADKTVLPGDQLRYYAEKVVYLPDSFLPRDTTCGIAPVLPTRAQAQLPETGIVFACFNNTYKITPTMFDIWMRLLASLEDSVLWLPQVSAVATQNLSREADARGIEPRRLVFAKRTSRLEDHLARLGLADLFLDTVPYNAHSTASDALWAGLPVLTCLGATFAGRVAASLLRALGLPELVADTPENYEATALMLARDPRALAGIRAKLASNRAALFDTKRFTKHLEAGFLEMYERHVRGEKPASFSIAASA